MKAVSRIVVVASFLAVLGFSTHTFAGAITRYDVSYLWHGGLLDVFAYKLKISKVLGPEVSRNLKVVLRNGLYGVIYHRRGSHGGAVRVARTHSKLLLSRGLESAAPIRSMNWKFFSPSAKSPSLRPKKPVSNGAMPRQTIADLNTAVHRRIKQLRRQGMIAADERTAWSVFDFTTGQKLVDINDDDPFQAASLAKPFFALAFFHNVENGDLIYGPRSRRHMRRMIQNSNNASTNWVMRHIGGPRAIQRILTTHYRDIFRDVRIVEYIPAGGRTYKNKASANDYNRFLHALWNDTIPGSREIKRLMASSRSDRLYTGVESIPKGTKVYNKTGSTASLCGDMGILVVKGKNGRSYPYTLVGIIEKKGRARHYSAWINSRSDVIRRVSNLVYAGISQRHNLHAL